MAATFVHGAASASGFNSTTTRSVTISVTAGDFLFAAGFSGSVSPTLSIADNSGSNTWVPITALNGGGGYIQGFYCLNAAGGSTIITLTDSVAGSTSRALLVGEWGSGVATAGTFGAVDKQTTHDAGFGVTSCSSGTTSSTSYPIELIVSYFGTQSSGKTFATSGAGAVEIQNFSNLGLLDQNVTSQGTQVSSVTWSGGSWGGGGIATFQYTAPVAATPTFSPVAGTYTGTQTVAITSATTGVTIYYTTDGSTPTESSPSIANGGTVSVASSLTLKAIAGNLAGYTDSAVGSAAYTINSSGGGSKTWNCVNLSQSLRGLRK